MSDDAARKALRIKAQACGRLARDVAAYAREAGEQQARVDALGAVPEPDTYALR